MQKVILVTGASSGIGKAIALHLVHEEHRVFGTSRHPKLDVMEGIEMLPLDVTSDESVADCIDMLFARTGKIDVVVNNAGVDFAGALEAVSIEEAKRLFETNFFGVMRVTSAVLPLMRQQKFGQIINISSGAGRSSIPFHGIYSASKYALEGYSEALMHEVEPFGIGVYLVEPGIYHSEIGNRTGVASHHIEAYAERQAAAIHHLQVAVAEGLKPKPVALRIGEIVDGKANGLRHPVGIEAILSMIKPFFPEWLWKRSVGWMFGINHNPIIHFLMSLLYRVTGNGAFVLSRPKMTRENPSQ